MRRISIISLLCAVTLLGACTRDIPGIDEEYNPAAPVSFVTNDDSGVDTGDAKGAATRGTPITNVSQMTTMGVFASATGTSDWSNATSTPNKMFNQKLTYNSGAWEYPTGEDVYWGATTLADRYTFFAYAPYGTGEYSGTNTTGNGITVSSLSTTAGTPTLTYTVPVKVENQPDLMVATKKNMRPTGSKVALDMKHALTSVAFQIKGNGEKVKAIAIKGVSVTGTLAVDSETITWSSLGAVTTTDFSTSLNYDTTGAGAGLYYTTTSTMSTNLIAGNGYLMMIPQTLTTDAKVVITYSDNSTKELALGTQTWEAGKKVTYNITFPPEGVIAPPGVIGYIKGTNTLTLKGSQEYSVNSAIKGYADANFGGLENATVYAAYFQFGSLIATSGDPFDSEEPYLEPEDIIAGPSQWTGYSTFKANPTWTGIPVYTSTDYNYQNSGVYTKRNISHPDYQTPSTGKGDPCMYYFGSEYGSSWKLPTGNPYNGTSNYSGSNLPWKAIGNLGTGLPAGRLSDITSETGIFYPATGNRTSSDGSVYSIAGYYWSSTAHDDSNGYSLYFSSSVVNPSDSYDYAYGFAVRCVPKPATPTGGVAAAPGVLAVDSQGNLNLDGNGHIVYFKWGSTIALSGSAGNGDVFDVSDIAWVPSGYDFGALKTSIGTSTGQIAWDMILNQTNTITEDDSKGWGDPCKQIPGGEWRMPTRQEYIAFVGQDGVSNDGFGYYNWAGNSGTASSPGIGAFPMGTAAGASLPATGYRSTNGSMYLQGSNGYYWSSTALDGSNAYDLYFSSSFGNASGTNTYTNATAIRCVPIPPKPKPPTGGVAAVPGVLAVDSQGNLNLDGNGYIVYFKWGSTIALSAGSGVKNDVFDVSDIAWVPPGYDFGALKTSIGSSGGGAGWDMILNQTNTITEDNSKGWGDPCKQIAGGNWRMPTRQDNIDFVGRSTSSDSDKDYSGKVYYSWVLSGTASASNPGFGNFPQGTAAGASLPAASYRYENNGEVMAELGIFGYYWSSTKGSGSYIYLLAFDSSSATPSRQYSNRYGFAVRCVPVE